MLIIIEGVDGSGKSTLADHLEDIISTEHEVEKLHRGIPENHALIEYETPLIDYVPGSEKTFVLDRWHIGADVYGPIKRNDDGLGSVVRWHITQFLAAKGAFVVYTEMQIEPLLQRLRTRGEDYLSLHEVEVVIETYRNVIGRTPLPKMLSLNGVHSALAAISDASQAQKAALNSGQFRSYIGPRRPHNLVVGSSETEIAFMPFEGTHAYDVISSIIETTGYSLDIGVIDCKEDLARAWDALYNPWVTVLDDESADACSDAHIPFSKEMLWI